MRSRFFIFSLCAGLLSIGSLGGLTGCSSKAAVPPPPRPAIVTHPQIHTHADDEVYSGDVHARYESQLGFRITGKIKRRRVDVGAHVKAGQVLAELDPLDLNLRVSSARATLASAQANRDLARSEYHRYRALLDKHYISRTQFDAQVNTLKAAQSQVDQAKAALAVARNQADYATLRADHAGTITAINAETGQVVAAGQPIATLAQDGAIEVEIAVPENRVGDYQAGEVATIQPWADAGTQMRGRLREIAPEADPVSRTYRVRVTVVDAGTTLHLGQSARVYFQANNLAVQTQVPLAALSEENGKPAVWVVDRRSHQVHPLPVVVSAYRERIALLEGKVGASQWIVAAGVHKLRDGQTISPVDSLDRPIRL